MGCCGSKQTEHEQDERSRLIDEAANANQYGANRMVATPNDDQSQVREQESLQKIVERTAGNLIDIPSTFQLERLEQHEAQNRSNEYMSALNTVKLPKQTIRKLHSMTSVKAGFDLAVDDAHNGAVRSSTSSIKAPSVRELLSEKTVDPKTIDWMASAVGELHQATESIDVEPVGDLTVTLSPPLTQ